MATTNYTLTNIALKRVSGKAQVSINNNVNQELIGSSIQSSNSTVFGESVPNAPSQTLYLVQSASVSDPGTVMYVEFNVYPIGDSLYANDPVAAGADDEGDVTTNTYHAYALYLSSAFDDNVTDFNTNASTGTSFGSFPFVGGSYLTGSAGKFQLVPSFLSTDTSTNNAYIPTLYSNEGSEMQPSDPSDWYLDPFSGILFIQDPTQYGTPNGDGSSPNTSTSIPGKIAAFMYVGKYQDEITFTANDVNFIVSGSDEGFAVGNDDTINFISGSAGITVESNSSTGTITIGESTDNVTFNNITATGDIIAQNYIVSSSITYMTQSFSSGSTIFGDSLDDTHQFTGSLYITSALNSGNSGSIIANSWISASDLYLTNTFTALDGGVTVTSNTNPELYVDGNITASGDISASGLLFANASDANGGANIEVAMYNTVTGQFYYTGSSALGDTTLLEASASAGIAVSSSGGTTTIPLTHTASFEGDSATGITVTNAAGTITIAADPDTLVNATSDTNTFYFTSSWATNAVNANTASYVTTAQTASYVTTAQTASYIDGVNVDGTVTSATSASVITVTDNESTAGAQAIIFAEPDTGNDVSLQSDATTFTYNPGTSGGQLKIGSTTPLTIDKDAIDTGNTTFALLNDTATTINFGGAATTINMGAANGTVSIAGSASIAGDLIVGGAVTSINTTNLFVEDQFILLNSGAASATDTGIIVQTNTTQNVGSALYWDTENSRWEIDYAGANASTNTAAGDAAIVAVRTGASSTPSDPYMGAVDAGIGQMYVDTSNPADGNNIWIYA